MRAIWKGAVAFGLVNVPVKLYAATGEHSVPLHQVHKADGGRIRYRKVCSVDGEEVPYAEIAKGYETDDGRMVVLTDEDLEELPLATEREISVEEFVPAEQVDPIMLGKTYYLEPERTAAKPYALLREALKTTERMAVVKVALRQRESMAVLRVRDDVICLQTLLWPDEVREADFPILDAEVSVRPQELQMAASLVESLAGDFDPSVFEDSYQAALEELIEAKVTSGSTVSPRAAAEEEPDEGGEVVDLLSALQRSVEKARGARAGGSAGSGSAGAGSSSGDTSTATGSDGEASDAAAGDDGSAKRTSSKRSTAKSTGSKKSTSEAAAEKEDDSAEASSARSSTKGRGSGTSRGKAKAAESDEGQAEEAPAKKTARRRAS
jgi:DNA end-binding protein Ku